jgi:hypothetical protein
MASSNSSPTTISIAKEDKRRINMKGCSGGDTMV